MHPQFLPALASALHIVGVAMAATFGALRLLALRRQDVPATRFADNGNGIGALLLFGAGFWRLLGGLEKPLAFYTANPIFWVKMGGITVVVLLEMYPQYVVLPWHIRHSRKLPIEPRPGQFERMFRLCALQLPILVVVIACAALMSRGVGLLAAPAPAPTSLPGQAIYRAHCQGCHQPDGRGLGGKVAADLGSPEVAARSDAALLEILARGTTGKVGAMPGWETTLTEQQRRDVLAYLRATFLKAPAAP